MTTRAEEIAAKEYPDLFIRDDKMKTSGTALISDAAQMLRREGFINGYKRGQQDRWIPLSERLPDSTEAGEKEHNLVNVLLQWKSGMSKVVLAARVSCWEDDQPLWSWVDENGDDDPFDDELATHWAPLPPNPEQR